MSKEKSKEAGGEGKKREGKTVASEELCDEARRKEELRREARNRPSNYSNTYDE
jgi:hypothetical protein